MSTFVNVSPRSPITHPECQGGHNAETHRATLLIGNDRYLPAERVTLYQKPDHFFVNSVYPVKDRFCLLFLRHNVIGIGVCECVQDESGLLFFFFRQPFVSRDGSVVLRWNELPYPMDLRMYVQEERPEELGDDVD